MAKRARPEPGQPVSDQCAYTLLQLQAATGLKETAIRAARSNGLRAKWVAGRMFFLGKDWLTFLDGLSDADTLNQ